MKSLIAYKAQRYEGTYKHGARKARRTVARGDARGTLEHVKHTLNLAGKKTFKIVCNKPDLILDEHRNLVYTVKRSDEKNPKYATKFSCKK